MTAAGKVIFARYGTEEEQLGLASILSTIIGRTIDTADPIK